MQNYVNLRTQTPSGRTIPSTGYNNGQFRLLLSHPMEGGTYTCVPRSKATPAGKLSAKLNLKNKNKKLSVFFNAYVGDALLKLFFFSFSIQQTNKYKTTFRCMYWYFLRNENGGVVYRT